MARTTYIHRMSAMLLATLVAVGCSAPGVGRIERSLGNDEMPPSLAYVSADTHGFTVLDTDPDSVLWKPVRRAAGDDAAARALSALHAPLVGDGPVDLDAIGSWIGPTAGRMRNALDLRGSGDIARMYYADVSSRRLLEQFLEDVGFTAQPANRLGAGELELWTRSATIKDGLRAVGVSRDAVVGARTLKGLRRLVADAERYAVPDRRTMTDYAVDARAATPASFVFRADLIREQLPRIVADDPALLELARWGLSSTLITTLRDGWVGVAPPAQRDRNAVRIVGSADWVGDLAPDSTPVSASRATLDALPSTTTYGIGFGDPGRHAIDLLSGISRNGIGFATDEDVPSGQEQVRLLDMLEQLDGESAIGQVAAGGDMQLLVASDRAESLAMKAGAAISFAGIDRLLAASSSGDHVLLATAGRGGAPPKPSGLLGDVRAYRGAFGVVDAPPSQPIAWLWKAASACSGRAAGWITWDRVARMSISIDVALQPIATCDTPLRDTFFPSLR